MLIRRKRKNIRVASRIQFCGGRPSAPEKGNIRRETLVLPCATYPETARPEAPLSKIFGDQIERVRFARTLRWREMDSNFRFRASSDYAGVGVAPAGAAPASSD